MLNYYQKLLMARLVASRRAMDLRWTPALANKLTQRHWPHGTMTANDFVPKQKSWQVPWKTPDVGPMSDAP